MEHEWDKYFDTESVYWAKVQQLYKDNDNLPKVVTRGMELHHKFLRCFSKLEDTPVDNDKDNLVSLTIGQHFLVHYYLWKCTNKGFKRYTAAPVVFMYKKGLSMLDDTAAEALAECWSDIKTDAKNHGGYKLSEETKQRMRKPRTKEHRKHISEANKGKSKNKKSDNPMFGKHHSDESKQKQSEAFKDKHWKLVNGKRVWY